MPNSKSSPAQIHFTLFVIGLYVAFAGYSWCKSELEQFQFETKVLADGSAFWTLPNTDYSSECILPDWVTAIAGGEFSGHFERVTKLDFCIDDLNNCDPALLEFYTQFKYVHTIRISNRHCKPEVVGILKLFPMLETINVEPWGGGNAPGYVDVSAITLPGVKVNCK